MTEGDLSFKEPQNSDSRYESISEVKNMETTMSTLQHIVNRPGFSEKSIHSETKQPSITEQILNLCNGIEFFRTPESDAFVTVPVKNHFEHYPVNSSEFQKYLSACCFKQTGLGLKASVFTDLLPTLEAKALYDGSEHKVHMRTAYIDGIIYVDICDENRSCVMIDTTGWKVITNPPVKFKRTKYMAALPLPVEYGEIVKLRKYINLSDDDYGMLIAWLLSAIKGTMPMPILVIMAGQGSGKSTATKIIRSLFDPSTVPLRSAYNNTRDLMVSCVNTYALVMDNISAMSDEMSDMLCGIATGTGQSHRVLHTNRGEDVLEGRNPIMINGIDGLPQRADFIDRAVLISPTPITEEMRVPETQLLNRFDDDKGKIFGGLCSALSSALKNLPDTKPAKCPRMADFYLLGLAASSQRLWTTAGFDASYQANQLELTHRTIESSVFIDMLVYFLQNNRHYFHGTISSLLYAIKLYLVNQTSLKSSNNETVDQTSCKEWPKSAQRAGQILRRFEPSLQKLGYKIVRIRGKTHERSRLIEISKPEQITT